jgi:hypothetical protein
VPKKTITDQTSANVITTFWGLINMVLELLLEDCVSIVASFIEFLMSDDFYANMMIFTQISSQH